MDFQNWDLAIGIITLAFLPVIPFIIRFIKSQLPTAKVPTMLALLDETDALLRSCSEEGLLQAGMVVEWRTRLDL